MINPNDIIYAKRLKELRLKKGDKQMATADMLGIRSQQEYSKLEVGKKHFDEPLILAICTVFHVNVTEFKGGENPDFYHFSSMEKNAEKDSKYLVKLVSVLEEKAELAKIVELFKTKYMLEEQLKLLDELIKEKKTTRTVFNIKPGTSGEISSM